MEEKKRTTLFQKGREKTGGRQKGTQNKTTTITKEILNDIAEGIRPQLAKDIMSLDPRDRIATFLKLVEFVVPKPQRLDVELSGKAQLTIEETLAKLAQENDD